MMQTKKKLSNNSLTKKNSHLLKSFSPSINRKLDIKRLKTLKNKSIKLCNNLLEINIGTLNNPKCVNFNNIHLKKKLLNNLVSSKHLDPTKFIPPKQLHSNCWFNTMFVVFFFSDKGRKFFRFFRNLMITGKKFDKSKMEDQELRKLLFIFNLYIEASYNQSISNTNKNKKKLYNQIKNLTSNLETNFLIKKIYNIIKSKSLSYSLPNINDAGNPFEYYKVIMDYMKYDILKILNINIYMKTNNKYENVEEIINKKFEKEYDILVIEDHESKMNYKKEYYINYKNNIYKYVLDSIILTNKKHYDPNENSHFVSVLTINKEEYKFDGSSYSKLSKFNWKKILNKDVDWSFKENPLYYPEKYNFQYGYKILFYYRS